MPRRVPNLPCSTASRRGAAQLAVVVRSAAKPANEVTGVVFEPFAAVQVRIAEHSPALVALVMQSQSLQLHIWIVQGCGVQGSGACRRARWLVLF